MKSNIIKLTVASGMLLGYMGAVSAHDVLNQPIGATVGATDYFQVTCTTDGVATERLEVQVNDDTAGASILSLQVRKGLVAKNTTDPVGANGVFSPLVSINGGNGIYDVIVDKTTAAARQYDIAFHCKSSAANGNVHTGTAVSHKQNQ